jgi:hypothetical protein
MGEQPYESFLVKPCPKKFDKWVCPVSIAVAKQQWPFSFSVLFRTRLS